MEQSCFWYQLNVIINFFVSIHHNFLCKIEIVEAFAVDLSLVVYHSIITIVLAFEFFLLNFVVLQLYICSLFVSFNSPRSPNLFLIAKIKFIYLKLLVIAKVYDLYVSNLEFMY